MALDPIKLELHNAQFFGDIVTGTAAVRDIASVRRCTECMTEANVPGRAMEPVLQCPNCGRQTFRRKFRVRFNAGGKPHFQMIFYGNPYIDDFAGEPDISLRLGTQIACNKSNMGGHITEAFRLAFMSKTGFDIPMGTLLPDLHLTEDEKNLPPVIDGRYWLISTGKRPPFTSKFWPPERWQAVVSSLPDITFVQVGYDDGKPESEHYHPVLYGDNVINMIGETQDERSGIRELFKLVYHADGCCSLVSSLMHLAAGFDKPCVIPAGAREPARFELYPFHRYIQNQGSMKCVGKDPKGYERDHQGVRSCFKQRTDACPNLDQGYPRCMLMIEPFQVANAIKSYYNGGALEEPKEPARKRTARKPIFKMVCNAHAYGGGERSSVWIANRMLLEGYDVHLMPSRNVNREFSQNLSPYVLLDSQEHHLTEPCDILMLYANDMTAGFEDRYKLLESVNTEKKIMVLNYRLFQAGETEWSKHWDQYIFLCSDLEMEFKERVPECNSLILPPPVDLQPFLDTDLGSLDKTLHVVRIGSQGSAKYPENIRAIVEQIKAIHPAVKFSFMGGHKSLDGLDYVDNIPAYSKPVMDVLKKASVFWYILPDDYLDNGPRVIMEAMAAGLPVVADNRGGAKDRLTPETGWLCDSVEEHIERIAKINSKKLTLMGKAAKERARTQFDPEQWVGAILEKEKPKPAELPAPDREQIQVADARKDDPEICFFTMANREFIPQARNLVLSGDIVGNPIWFFRIPDDDSDPIRYKMHLLESDLLPDADKYVFVDADCLMIKQGDWGASDCWGAKNEPWTNGGDGYKGAWKAGGFDEYKKLYTEHGSPLRVNAGVFVLSNEIRRQFAKDWREWCLRFDAISHERLWVRDGMGYIFTHHQYKMPLLPDRFHCIVKREQINDRHVLIHAAGHPTGDALKQYTDAVDKMLGGNLDDYEHSTPDCRWQVLTDLIMRHTEDPAHPVIAEMGVFKGETTRHLLRTFPGLRIYCIDNRNPPGVAKKISGIEEAWNALMAEYPDRLIYYEKEIIDVDFPEPLDGIFDDADHRTEAVIAHAKKHWGALKPGGFYAVHDCDQPNGSYYDQYSVRKALDELWPGKHQTGPDYMAWTIKQEGGNDGKPTPE